MGSPLVCGAGGFIGGHLVKRLKSDGFWVRGVDLKNHKYAVTEADDFVIGDLRDPYFCRQVIDRQFDEIYQLAADMGGAGFVFVGENDADIMHNSGLINLNILDACYRRLIPRVFYSSSACMYPAYNQTDPDSPNCEESSAYPAAPDSEYGWEKLFSEASILLSLVVVESRFESLAITISSAQRGPGTAAAKRRRLRCAARSR